MLDHDGLGYNLVITAGTTLCARWPSNTWIKDFRLREQLSSYWIKITGNPFPNQDEPFNGPPTAPKLHTCCDVTGLLAIEGRQGAFVMINPLDMVIKIEVNWFQIVFGPGRRARDNNNGISWLLKPLKN